MLLNIYIGSIIFAVISTILLLMRVIIILKIDYRKVNDSFTLLDVANILRLVVILCIPVFNIFSGLSSLFISDDKIREALDNNDKVVRK